MLLKMLGSTMVIISCGMIGLKFSSNYEERLEILLSFKKCFRLLKNEINHTNLSLIEALKNIQFGCDEIIKKLIDEIVNRYENNKSSLHICWQESIDCIITKTSLKEKEIDILKVIGTNLGVTNRENQIEYIDSIIEKINVIVEDLQSNKTNKCKVYKSMGVMTGLLIVILFV